MKKSIIITLLCCAGIMALGFWSGLSTQNEINNWYLHLYKPTWNPPNWIFAPVWSIIYLLMGISLTQIIQKQSIWKKIALWVFAIQFGFNLLWTQLFFSYHLLLVALIEIILLWMSILFTMYYFSQIHKLAAYLLVPYILWVSFASLLTLQIYLLN